MHDPEDLSFGRVRCQPAGNIIYIYIYMCSYIQSGYKVYVCIYIYIYIYTYATMILEGTSPKTCEPCNPAETSCFVFFVVYFMLLAAVILYVYIYIYIYIYIYTHYFCPAIPQSHFKRAPRQWKEQIYIYIYIYTYIHTYIYIYMYIHIYVYLYLSLSLYIYIYICIHTHKPGARRTRQAIAGGYICPCCLPALSSQCLMFCSIFAL